MTTQPISSNLLRALQYVGMAEDGGYPMTTDEIDAFASTPEPKRVSFSGMVSRFAEASLLSGFSTQESVAKYMIDVNWLIDYITEVRLSKLGRAILRASMQVSDALDDVVIVSPEDPFALPLLTKAIDRAGEGLLADPYFKDDWIPWLISNTSITQLLLCRAEGERKSLSYFLHAVEAADRQLEIKALAPKEFHDRYIRNADNEVFMLGASFNGLHKNFSALVRVPSPGDNAIKAHIDELWERADVIDAELVITPK